jgi:hypothetical protein
VIRLLLDSLFLQLGDWRRPQGPPPVIMSHHSSRSATFKYHVEQLLFLFKRLTGLHNQSGPRSRGKSYYLWKVSERCQSKRRTAAVQLLWDAIFWRVCRRNSEILTRS